MTRTLLVDGDINAYQVAASIEVPTDWGDGLWTLHSDANQGINVLDGQLAGLMEKLEADAMVVVLTGKGNFRYEVLPTYKSNRKNTRRPTCLPVMRQHLMDNYDTRLMEGLEGDDILGIMSTGSFIKGEKIIVSIDKDMKTIPGLYYNANHPEEGVMEVTEEEADYWHLFQTLTGDSTDGYKGCPGVGPVAAQRLLELEPSWDQVVNAYHKAKLGEEEALAQARCARILRASDFNFKTKEPILWSPQ